MKRVFTALVLVPVVLILVLRAPLWLLAPAVAVVALLAAREYLDLVAAYNMQPFRTLTGVLVIAFCVAPVIARGDSLEFLWLFLAAIPIVFLCASFSRPDLRDALPAASSSALGCIYIGFPFFCLVYVRGLPAGWFAVLLVLLLVWSGDVFAYYIGRYLGRRPLAPRISPRKTWEGTVASLLGTNLIAHLLFEHAESIARLAQNFHLLALSAPSFHVPRPLVQVLLAIGLNAAAQLGDLAESMIKRGANIKDSGTLLPGHGGVLDRIDALLFAAPFAVLLSALMPVIY